MARFAEASSRLCEDAAAVESVINGEVAWAHDGVQHNVRQRRAYRAIWLILRDLIRVGWQFRTHENVFELAPPSYSEANGTEDQAAYKELVRMLMAPGRRAKLAEARAFIERMENPRSNGRAIKPVTALIADPVSLADDLERCATSGDPSLLNQCIQPELVLVEEGRTCEYTGLKLGDIWRYFRFFWVTPPENTPGRTMLYLVRDKARENHPIIGIASLENSPLRLAVRDYFLGWSKEAFLDSLENASASEAKAAIESLVNGIDQAIGEIKTEGLATSEELVRPTEEVIARLASAVARTNREKDEALQRWRAYQSREETSESEEEVAKSELGTVSLEFEEALFRRKRADALGRLVTAKRVFQLLLERSDFDDAWRMTLTSETGQSAIWAALVGIKSRHVGTSILELNVCGAIPPYNDVLGGKLVALLALSPQILEDYRRRYGSRSSDIASRMKDEVVVRPAELLFLGTTSLFKGNSSQYNRLKLPAGLFSEGSPEIRWQLLKKQRDKGDIVFDGLLRRGETSGYGTLHIAPDTLQALDEATDVTTVNHVFGEGASPKLRTIRFALERLFDPGQRQIIDEITRHAMTRIVYGAFLASNAADILRGSSEGPIHKASVSTPQEGTARIVEYWRERWLRQRLMHSAAIDRIRHLDPSSFILGRQLDRPMLGEFEPIEDPMAAEQHPQGDWREFVRLLSGGTSAFADRTDLDWLKSLHVPTQLDDVIVAAAGDGLDIVLTGNPGDGKTHLLRVLEERLAELNNRPSLLLDASAMNDEQVIAHWKAARDDGSPFAAAINEAVLYNLARTSDFLPVVEAQKLARRSVVYGTASNPVSENVSPSVAVFDLSRRNTLESSIVRAVRDKLLDPSRFSPCAFCNSQCDAMRHAELLRDDEVLGRLQGLLDRLAATGHHVTIRDLQAFFSHLIFSERSCPELLATSSDDKYMLSNAVFSGSNAIARALSRVCDPAKFSHPVLDEALLLGNESIRWAGVGATDFTSLDPGDTERFAARKRAYYFFHPSGGAVFDGAHSDELEFAKLLSKTPREILRHIHRRINAIFGDTNEQDYLWAWQSHHYDQSTASVFFAAARVDRNALEVVTPGLSGLQATAFSAVRDHVLLRLKSDANVALRIDFALFRLLEMADRGVPVLSLPGRELRNLLSFLERLARSMPQDELEEVRVRVRDLSGAESIDVRVAASGESAKYLSIQSRGGAHAG